MNPLIAAFILSIFRYIALVSGNGTFGGEIELIAGTSDNSDGPNVLIHAGDSSHKKSSGGALQMSAGSGTSENFWDGGNGGSVEISAGHGFGNNKLTDVGGDVEILGVSRFNSCILHDRAFITWAALIQHPLQFVSLYF